MKIIKLTFNKVTAKGVTKKPITGVISNIKTKVEMQPKREDIFYQASFKFFEEDFFFDEDFLLEMLYGRSFTESVEFTDAITALYKKLLSENVAFSEGLLLNMTLNKEDAYSVSDEVILNVDKGLKDDMSLTEFVKMLKTFGKNFIDSMVFYDNVVKRFEKNLSDDINLNETLFNFLSKGFSENFGLAELTTISSIMPKSDNLSINESFLLAYLFYRTFNDTVDFQDFLSFSVGFTKKDPVAFNDFMKFLLGSSQKDTFSMNDGITTTDVWAVKRDTFAMADSLIIGWLLYRTFDDSFSFTEVLLKSFVGKKDYIDIITLQETFGMDLTRAPLFDLFEVSDSVQLMPKIPINDLFQFNQMLSKEVFKQISESIVVAENGLLMHQDYFQENYLNGFYVYGDSRTF